jgi:hypothetical protein
MEKLEKMCPCCVEYEKTYEADYKKLGFVFFSGIMMRQCPSCRVPYEKNKDGCCHLTCITKNCNTHFCYCCDVGFTSSGPIYQHLREVYDTFYPTLIQIKEKRL